MKKILVGLILVTSLPSFASTNLICGIFKGATIGTPVKELVLDLDISKNYKSVFSSENQMFTATLNSDFVTIGFSDVHGKTKTIISVDILRNMKFPQSIGIESYSAHDESKNYTAVCFQTGDSTTGPWSIN